MQTRLHLATVANVPGNELLREKRSTRASAALLSLAQHNMESELLTQ